MSDITTGLVGWWRFDDGTGTTAIDSSGNGNTGTLAGAPLPTWVAGQIGAFAVNIPTDAQAVTVATGASLNSLTAFTWAAWISCTTVSGAAGGNQRIIDKSDVAADTGGAVFSINPGGSLALKAENWQTTKGAWATSSPTTIAINTWTHVAMTYSYGATTNNPVFYINGTVIASSALAVPAGTVGADTQNMVIGNRTGTDIGLAGSIDDVRTYNRILTAADIATLFAYRNDARLYKPWSLRGPVLAQ